jgi:hypothetical protein
VAGNSGVSLAAHGSLCVWLGGVRVVDWCTCFLSETPVSPWAPCCRIGPQCGVASMCLPSPVALRTVGSRNCRHVGRSHTFIVKLSGTHVCICTWASSHFTLFTSSLHLFFYASYIFHVQLQINFVYLRVYILLLFSSKRSIILGWGDVDWIDLAQDRNRWRALVNSVLNPRVPWNAGKLSSGLTSSGLSISVQLHILSLSLNQWSYIYDMVHFSLEAQVYHQPWRRIWKQALRYLTRHARTVKMGCVVLCIHHITAFHKLHVCQEPYVHKHPLWTKCRVILMLKRQGARYS